MTFFIFGKEKSVVDLLHRSIFRFVAHLSNQVLLGFSVHCYSRTLLLIHHLLLDYYIMHFSVHVGIGHVKERDSGKSKSYGVINSPRT